MASAVRVVGLRQLQRAFNQASPELHKDVRLALRTVAEPIAADAQSLALGRIRRMPSSPKWAQMRIGVTQTLVYVAPQQRGIKSRTDRRLRRPNLADLLMGRAMQPALDKNVSRVEVGVGLALDKVVRKWNG